MNKQKYGKTVMKNLDGMQSDLDMGNPIHREKLFDYIFKLHSHNVSINDATEFVTNEFGFTKLEEN